MTQAPKGVSRRRFLRGAAALASSAGLAAAMLPRRATAAGEEGRAASPPEGFSPLSKPGEIVKATQGDDLLALMQPNRLWPKPEVAREMLTRALSTFTGEADLVGSLRKFIHPEDTVALKVNGIGGQSGGTMAVNFELILPMVQGLIELGVPAEKITLYEQFGAHMLGTRTRKDKLPRGVRLGIHGNVDSTMRPIEVHPGIRTRYVRFLTEATAVINMALLKDHSICGYTGCLKNMAQGSIVNPSDHHGNAGSPMIAELYGHEILRSRVRLHITDGYKLIYDEGPLDKNPRRRILHGAVYVSTDPVAMDTYGRGLIEQARADNGLRTLKQAGREPDYIRVAGEEGLGVHDASRLRVIESQGPPPSEPTKREAPAR